MEHIWPGMILTATVFMVQSGSKHEGLEGDHEALKARASQAAW